MNGAQKNAAHTFLFIFFPLPPQCPSRPSLLLLLALPLAFLSVRPSVCAEDLSCFHLFVGSSPSLSSRYLFIRQKLECGERALSQESCLTALDKPPDNFASLRFFMQLLIHLSPTSDLLPFLPQPRILLFHLHSECICSRCPIAPTSNILCTFLLLFKTPVTFMECLLKNLVLLESKQTSGCADITDQMNSTVSRNSGLTSGDFLNSCPNERMLCACQHIIQNNIS